MGRRRSGGRRWGSGPFPPGPPSSAPAGPLPSSDCRVSVRSPCLANKIALISRPLSSWFLSIFIAPPKVGRSKDRESGRGVNRSAQGLSLALLPGSEHREPLCVCSPGPGLQGRRWMWEAGFPGQEVTRLGQADGAGTGRGQGAASASAALSTHRSRWAGTQSSAGGIHPLIHFG